ncbi:DUF4297 family anti-phage-associated protein [Nonlabens agnitus]|uniref:Uncharacterized protein n=1 Tax=Nonlabens agnitus TaxID=870484 RepID=A0A2S9WS37_9FLAO|nr:DUF4297 family anti-phage-associated protein [Nonlabens agnitus]PRP66268.1 hypothetical protein BST86_03760 [Nonlabens agnitus]
MNRSAVDTIKGYYYQFDLTILKLLESQSSTDTVIVENVEDIDLLTATETTAVQCKYYAKTEYNHSVIAHPIRQMLNHFSNLKIQKEKNIRYHLYGHYKSGQNKLILPLTLDYLKKHFLTFKKRGKKIEYHKDLGLKDVDLDEFIQLLSIDNNAQSYDSQIGSLISLLQKEFNCTNDEARDYYYNNSLRVIKDKSVEQDSLSRTITRRQFIKSINKKEDLFNIWYAGYLGRSKFLKKIRSEHFTFLNISPFDRFFLIGVNPSMYSRNELKEMIQLISKKWSNLSKKVEKPFCPYIYISGISETEITELKKEFFREGFVFNDGHPFLGSDFSAENIMIRPDHNNDIRIKIINELNQLDTILYRSTVTKQIFQFYTGIPFYNNDSENLKHIKVQLHTLTEIKKII